VLPEIGQFPCKNLHSAAQLISTSKRQIQQHSSKFCGLPKTVVPKH